MENLHQYREEYKTSSEQHPCVRVDPFLDIRGHERQILRALEKHEIDYGCHGYTAIYSDFPCQTLVEVEGEDKPGDILDDVTADECYGYRYEDGHDHRQGFLRVHVVGES